MQRTNQSLNDFLSAERRTPITLALVFLPWLVVVLFTAGSWAALNFVGYAITIFAVGYLIVSVALPSPARAPAVVLAPAAGILVSSPLTAFWVRLGLPIIWVPVIWLGLMATGARCLWRDRAGWAKSVVAYGGALIALSTLICVIYFLPGACNDAVFRRDGSFNWMYGDTQFFHSMAASIKSDGSPPKAPGMSGTELRYHFGPYAPAAAISRFDGLNLGDAYARVTRGASQWALVLSCFALGTILSLKANGKKFGGVLSVAGLFFYGSLLSLFSDERNGASFVKGAVLFTIPKVEVLAQGGPFSHIILGHSVLHGLVAITVIMCLCLVQRGSAGDRWWREILLLALPALAVAVNSVAALYCLGVVGILLYWGRLGAARSWLSIALILCLFLGAWQIMGYSNSADVSRVTFNTHPPGGYWWPIAVWFMFGLGFRIVGFGWIANPWRDPLAALVLASVVGMLSFSLLLELDGSNERYGIYFLQSIFSILTFSRLTYGCWKGVERTRWTEEWMTLAKRGMALLVACGVVIRIVVYLRHSHTWTTSFRYQFLPCCLLVVILAGGLPIMQRSPRFAAFSSAVVMSILAFGFLAWVTPWLNFGMGRMQMHVTLSPGEVQGLKRLHELAAMGERFATNKHDVDRFPTYLGRSYAYAGFSERPVLLEGYADHTDPTRRDFKMLFQDNELIFSSTDPEKVRAIAEARGVRWLVARPYTDIALPKPLPPWLVEQQNCGDLKIYRVN
jgi:hypothetical protein